MMTALVYVLTSFTLIVILALARTSGHETANGVAVFRYQAGLLRVIFWSSPIPFILMAFVYVVTTPRMSNLSLLLLLVFGAIGSGLLFYAYRYLNSVRVEVAHTGLNLLSLRSTKSVGFQDIRRLDYIEGDKGVFFLDLFGAKDTRLARLAGTLQDFDELHRLVKAGAIACGAAYRCRDKWGKWST